MKVTELRIGNLIEINEMAEPVVSIDKYGINYTVNSVGSNAIKQFYHIDRVKPILITKEWLLKFGFVQQYWRFFPMTYYQKRNMLYSLSDGNVELHDPNICLTQLKYVHELQNFYFALTGEELILLN
jgi:hypothetical protein